MTNPIMRTTLLWLVTACSSTAIPADIEDPTCAGEDRETARLDGELPWELDRDLDSDRFACPDGEPDCDRLDEPDAPDDIETPDAAIDSAGGNTLFGLADPQTTSGKYRTWPNGRIPYRLARDANGNPLINATTRTRLSQAMTNWETLTEGRIKFRAKQSTDTAYVVIKQGSPRVRPFVGYRKDQVQELFLRDSEYITVIKHELGHVVGLHHEQRRSDRANHIKVRTANIVASDSCRYQFSVCTNCKKVGTYDRNSVMHYRTSDLGNCRTGPVLLKLDGTAIQHYWKLSARDLTSVATMYAAAPPPPPPPPMPEEPVLPESGSIVGNELCASVAGASTEGGAAIESGSCDGAGNQDWRITRAGQLRAQHSLQCAAVLGCSAEGALVEQTTCDKDAPDQKWLLTEMELVHGVTSKCADLAAYEAGAAIGIAACTGAANQRLDYDSTAETLQAGGWCLTASDGAIVLGTCDGSDAQRWFQARGGFVTRANTSQCLKVAESGSALAVGDCTDTAGDRWALRGAIRDARGELCLSAGTAGTPLALATCDGSAAQSWTFWSR